MAPEKKMWKKRYLIPLWIVQLIALGIYFILAIIGISTLGDADNYTESNSFNRKDADRAASVFRTSFGVILAFSSLCMILIFVEIGLAAAHKLKPTFYLVSAVIRAVLSILWFIMVVASVAGLGGGSGGQIVLALALILSTVIQVIYGGVRVHRVRKGFYNFNGGHGPVTYKGQGQGDVELQAGQAPVYR